MVRRVGYHKKDVKTLNVTEKICKVGPLGVSESFCEKIIHKGGGITNFGHKFFCLTVPKKIRRRHVSSFDVCEYLPLLVIDCTCMLKITRQGKK